ncbi:MAG: DNA-processing protein DprA [Ottowia sp.]|nr:DNA-processing protein DprA [Ottowia sp.]
MEHAELAAWLRLLLTDGVGSATARRLLAAFGLPQAIFLQSHAALRQVVRGRQADALLREPDKLPAQLETTQRWLNSAPEGTQRRILTLGDALYPPTLLNIEDPPPLLYAEGRIDALERSGWPPRAIAIVGSRSPTPQGALNARRFARELGAAGVCITSGMALGIDGAAHEGALEACGDTAQGIATIAVLGTGLDICYPRRHAALAQRIAQSGLLVSEYPLGTPPAPPNFPRRNRIIAGLAQGTLVVEAALRSGSLITARLAAEQGKSVFAVPGSIHSQLSRGAHDLIRQGACLAESVQDVLQEMQWEGSAPAPATTPAAPSPAAPEAGNDDDALLRALGADPVSLDALQARTGWPTEQLQVRLLELELAGQLARLPGGLFQRTASA